MSRGSIYLPKHGAQLIDFMNRNFVNGLRNLAAISAILCPARPAVAPNLAQFEFLQTDHSQEFELSREPCFAMEPMNTKIILTLLTSLKKTQVFAADCAAGGVGGPRFPSRMLMERLIPCVAVQRQIKSVVLELS